MVVLMMASLLMFVFFGIFLWLLAAGISKDSFEFDEKHIWHEYRVPKSKYR